MSSAFKLRIQGSISLEFSKSELVIAIIKAEGEEEAKEVGEEEGEGKLRGE